MNPATGPKSTSFKISAAGIATGVGMIITDYVQNTNGTQDKVNTAIGGAITLFSILGKLFHDKGLNAASLTTAAKDVAAVVPEVTPAIDAVKSDVAAISTRVSTLEALHVPAHS